MVNFSDKMSYDKVVVLKVYHQKLWRKRCSGGFNIQTNLVVEKAEALRHVAQVGTLAPDAEPQE